MRYLIIIIPALALWVGCSLRAEDQQMPTPDWPEVTKEAKPWTRWWWHGSAVTKEGITSELTTLKNAGIGGVEITPIFGVKGEEQRFINFLSPEWVEMLLYTLQEAERLGLGVDMATGTGWPFGGPWISDRHAPKNMVYQTYQVTGGQQLQEKVDYNQQPMVRAVGKSKEIDQVKAPISSNSNLQQLALDQVRFSRSLPLIALMAYGSNGEILDLTAYVSDGQLNWTAPEGQWKLYAVFQGWHGKMVERAAPGGEGNVIDHFSNEALKVYLSKFDSAFSNEDITSLRAFFNDSYEVDDASGQANWTPGFFEAFLEQHQYDLRHYLPALFGGSNNADLQRRVLTDYRATIDNLIFENFTREWKSWAREKGALIRNQAHGSPANILDLYAEVDIPETEGTEMLKIKFASSAANVTGKRLSSSESATWLSDHFESSLADVRKNLERYLLGGINHIFYHGTAYSPDDAPWPGWLFYAAIHANDRNTWWDDFGKLNEYITRIQSFMQNSQPDNDLLVYFPIYDRFAEPGSGLLEHFDIRGHFYKSAMKKIGDTLLAKGVAFDFVSDKQILQLVASKGAIETGHATYQAVLIPATEFIPLSTLEKLRELSEVGVPILFHQRLPGDVPGLKNLKDRQARLRQLNNRLKDIATISPSLDNLLAAGKVQREPLVEEGLRYIRKKIGSNTLYFIVNWSDVTVDKYVKLSRNTESAIIFNPMTGEKGRALCRDNSIYLQLASGESCLVMVSSDSFTEANYPYYEMLEGITIQGPWQVEAVQGGPKLFGAYTLDSLISWTDFAGEEGVAFSGTAIYSTTFPKPRGHDAYRLDLGEVHESARVYLNGELIETLIGPDYSLIIPEEKFKSENELKIAVSNLMANRIRYMDINNIEYRRFYNVNFPAYKKENSRDGLFHADHWSPQTSGLLGPVRLIGLRDIIKPMDSVDIQN